MIDNGPVWLLVNSASGSNDDEAVERIRSALTGAGAAPDRIVDIQEGCPTGEELAAGGVALAVVFAGDGTTNGIITQANGWSGTVLVLPGGTANLLARELHGEREADEIAAELASLRRVRRHGIVSSAGTALIELLAGPGAAWSDVREGIREGDLAQIATSGIEAVKASTTGPLVRITEPPLGKPDGYAGVRLVPQDRGMAVSGYGAEGFGDYLRHGVALLKRDYREGPHEDFGLLGAVSCRSSDGARIELMIDGERRTGLVEERFSLAELGVTLLASP
ncbi:MAG: diacylglycerol kinase family protein [Novosphingobium sp.]